MWASERMKTKLTAHSEFSSTKSTCELVFNRLHTALEVQETARTKMMCVVLRKSTSQGGGGAHF